MRRAGAAGGVQSDGRPALCQRRRRRRTLSTNGAAQAELLELYTDYLCRQVGPSCTPASMTFVIAGMNDIDQRCDGYLTWLDGKRRDREPILAQIAAVGAAVHAVMTVTGSSPKSLEILSSAFGLASATYSNWNSRLLISIEQSTVQAVVYKAQRDVREKIRGWDVPDRPTAIYMLRNYLRTCMPTTIEASINMTTMLVQRNAPMQATKGLVVSAATQPTMVRFAPLTDVTSRLRAFARANPANVTLMEQWMARNGIDSSISIAQFLRSADHVAEQRRMATELNVR